MYQYVLNGLSGSSADKLLEHNFDPGVLRPYREVDGRGRYTGRNLVSLLKRRNDGSLVCNGDGTAQVETMVTNAPATLRREDWLRIDTAVAMAAKPRLRVWGDIYGANPLTIANGMGVPAIQHAVATGDASATINMEPLVQGERSRPTVDTAITPLPVIYGDGSFTLREIQVSRNGSMPLDTTNIELTTRKVAEKVEQLCLGTLGTFTYAGGSIYGLTNHPSRSTKTLTNPTGSNGSTVIAEVVDMVQTLRNHFYYGPYIAYYSNAYFPFLATDYATGYPGTLGDRLKAIDVNITWRSADFLGTGFKIVVVQMTPDVVQGINGMPMTTVQWDEEGGFNKRFKVLTISIPRVRADANGYVGIVDGSGT